MMEKSRLLQPVDPKLGSLPDGEIAGSVTLFIRFLYC